MTDKTTREMRHDLRIELYDGYDGDPGGYENKNPFTKEDLQRMLVALGESRVDGGIGEVRYALLQAVGIDKTPFKAANPLVKSDVAKIHGEIVEDVA